MSIPISNSNLAGGYDRERVSLPRSLTNLSENFRAVCESQFTAQNKIPRPFYPPFKLKKGLRQLVRRENFFCSTGVSGSDGVCDATSYTACHLRRYGLNESKRLSARLAQYE